MHLVKTMRDTILQHLNRIDSAASNKDRKNCQTSSTFPLSVIIVEETSPFNNDFGDKGAQKTSNAYTIFVFVFHSDRRTFSIYIGYQKCWYQNTITFG